MHLAQRGGMGSDIWPAGLLPLVSKLDRAEGIFVAGRELRLVRQASVL